MGMDCYLRATKLADGFGPNADFEPLQLAHWRKFRDLTKVVTACVIARDGIDPSGDGYVSLNLNDKFVEILDDVCAEFFATHDRPGIDYRAQCMSREEIDWEDYTLLKTLLPHLNSLLQDGWHVQYCADW